MTTSAIGSADNCPIYQEGGGKRVKTLTAPAVNLNGSSADSLSRGYSEAATAIHLAMHRLGEAYPHGRDYLQGCDPAIARDRMEAAQAEHDDRMRRLREVYTELGALCEAIYDRKLTVEVELT